MTVVLIMLGPVSKETKESQPCIVNLSLCERNPESIESVPQQMGTLGPGNSSTTNHQLHTEVQREIELTKTKQLLVVEQGVETTST